jgi:hypothetical protein
MPIPQVQRMIESGAKHWRWFSGILRRAENYNGIRRPRLIMRAPEKDRHSRDQPHAENSEYHNRQYPPDHSTPPFCLCSLIRKKLR